MRRLRLLTPILNDWTSFSFLLKELDQLAASLPVRISVSAINDGSTLSPEKTFEMFPCSEISKASRLSISFPLRSGSASRLRTTIPTPF